MNKPDILYKWRKTSLTGALKWNKTSNSYVVCKRDFHLSDKNTKDRELFF